MEALLIRRAVLQNNVDRVQFKIKDVDVDTLTNEIINAHLARIYQLRGEGDLIESSMAQLCKPAELQQTLALLTVTFDSLDELIVKLTSMNSPPIGIPHPCNPSITSNIKLPTLSLTSFSGNVSDWLSFHDLFVASVHDNAKLSGAQKLQYLKTALKGDAEKLIQSISVTDDNYIGAWELLLNRYQNKRENIFAHFDWLFSQPTGQTESATNLRNLHDTTMECVRALKVLGCQTDNWVELLVYFVAKRFDAETRRKWELSLERDDLSTFDELCKFVDKQAYALAAAGQAKGTYTSNLNIDIKSSTTSHHTQDLSCILCSGNHYLSKCETFIKLTPSERFEKAKFLRLCFNCLQKGKHTCSKKTCQKCDQRQHTLLHFDKKPEKSKSGPGPTVTAHYSSDKTKQIQVLMSTILVKIRSSKGQDHIFRALLDTCSNFISEDCHQKIGFKQKRANVSVTGLNQSGVGLSHGSVQFRISSLTKDYDQEVEALIMKNVTGIQPQTAVDVSTWTHISNLKLADPKFNQPGKVDLLLSANIWARSLIGNPRTGPTGSAIAYETHFGWVLSGDVESQQPQKSVTVYHTQCDLEVTLKKFWKIEELPSTQILTPEEKKCEQHFATTHSRDSNGRYIVQLPFKETDVQLGASKTMAIKRFNSIERRLASNPNYQQHHIKFMREYESLGHMKLISEESPINKSYSIVPYYIPHHFVYKSNSPLSKFGVVFDASAKTTSGHSLNSTLMVGPKLQDDLVPLLLRFRTHAVALTADISEMYRQICVDPVHQDFQRIVWRESLDLPLQEYRLQTVTHGTASAPYLATKCLQQLANDEGHQSKSAAKIL